MNDLKAALLVGIDDYTTAPLTSCVRDANALGELLLKNEDGSSNFHCITRTAPVSPHASARSITRKDLREQLEKLFSKSLGVALFYFAGHGVVTSRGGFLVTQDDDRYDEGVSMEELLNYANGSKSDEVFIILDCCFSGKFGSLAGGKEGFANLREGVSVLAASSPIEPAVEQSGRGVFTSLVCGALEGGASDMIGRVTAASVYAYVDQALGAWDQRPMFKANLARLTPLRKCRPELPLDVLRRILEYFLPADADHRLDPSYEQDSNHRPVGVDADPKKVAIFEDLRKFRAARLVVPVGEEHMFWAAIHGKSCRLTPLGRFYWKLVKENKV